MKKSSSLTLTLLASAAMLVTSGCRQKTEVRNCIDENSSIVDDFNCDPRRLGYSSRPRFWRYGGNSGGHIGDAVIGGSPIPSRGTSSVSGTGSVSRGGFGSSMSSSSS